MISLLHVDNDQNFLKTTRDYLEKTGDFQVHSAASVKDALEILSSRSFDVIVSAHIFRKLDGIGLLKTLRSQDDTTPFIFFSSSGTGKTAMEALNLGAGYFLPKGAAPEAELPHLRKIAGQVVSGYRKDRDLKSLVKIPYQNPAPVMRVSKEGMLIFANPSSEPLLESWGITPGQMIPGVIRKTVDAAMSRGDVVKTEYVAGDRTYDITFRPTVSEGYVNIYGYDITKRKRAETALHESKKVAEESLALLQTLIQNAPVGFAFVDNGFRFVQVNDALAEINGLPRALHIGRTVEEIVPDIWPRLKPVYNSVLETGKPVINIELHRKSADQPGLNRYLLGNYYPVRTTSNEIIGIGIIVIDITEKKESEDALRKREAQLNLSQQIAHIGSWDLDLKENHLTWSDEIYRIFEISKEAFGASYEAFLNQIHPEDREMVNTAYSESVKNRTPYEIEHRLLFPDGRIKYVLEQCETYYDDERQPVRSAGVVQDITRRRQADEAVKAEHQRLNDILDMLPVYVVVLTRDYQVPFANRFFRERFGESGGRRCYEYLFNRTSPCETCETFTVLKTHEPHHWEWLGPDGRNYDIFDFPLTDPEGSPLILEMGIDITERMRAEEALRSASTYNRILLEASLDPLVTISHDGKISDVNEATIKITGYSREDLVGTDFSRYFTEPETAKAGYEKVFRDGHVRDYELQIRHRNGEVTPVLYNATLYRNESGDITGVFAAARDITERKRAENLLMRFNVDLEIGIREKTAELADLNALLKEEIAQRKLADETLRKTLSLLNASLESTADGILVVDRAGKIGGYNQNFATMWRIPESVLKSREDASALQYVRAQIKNPDGFLDRITDIYSHPERESYDMVEISDGRIFERYSKPQKIGNAVVGRVWSFRDITERKKAEETLVASLTEKEVLLREIHHRVKNNLQLISGLLDMTRMRTPDLATNSILTDMMMKIQTMAQIHTRLYESKQFGKISLEGQVRDQIAALSNIYSSKQYDVTCGIDSQEIYLPVDQAIPCALVVNEILSNAYKHAFRGRKHGTIGISMTEDTGKLRIAVRDDGIGFPEEFDIDRANSLGLKLIRTLVQHQLKGSVTFSSHNGTEVIVEFPLQSAGM